MAKISTIELTWISGKKYTFIVYSSDTVFKAIGGIYMISKRNNQEKTHKFIYIWETGDLSTRFSNHHRQSCFDQRWYNCISVYLEDDEDERLIIEEDLIDEYDLPCNKQ